MVDLCKAAISGTVISSPLLNEKNALTYRLGVVTRTAKIKVGILAKEEAAKIMPSKGDFVVITGSEIFINRNDTVCSFSVFIKNPNDIFITARDEGFVNAEDVL